MHSLWEILPRASREALFVWRYKLLDDVYAGFVDAGFLIAESARILRKKPNEVRLNASCVIDWHRLLGTSSEVEPSIGGRLLRVYWYDGAYTPAHARYGHQRRYHDAIAHIPGVQLRLGQLVERTSDLKAPIYRALENTAIGLGIAPQELIDEFEKNWKFYPTSQQKGVDTLIALDMVRLASRSAFGTAIVISGDRDLAEVIRTVQDYGIRVLVATPNRSSVAGEVLQIADGVIEISMTTIMEMLSDRLPAVSYSE